MRALILAAALVLAAPAYACNIWQGDTEEREACRDSKARNASAEEQSEAQTRALQDIADQLRAQNILRAGRDR